MIERQWRYFAPGGSITPRGPSTWYVLDWDQRRIIAITMDEEQEEEDKAIQFLDKHIASLGDDVFKIHVSLDGELISKLTDLEDDETTCVHYAELQELEEQLNKPAKTILRTEMRELERLTPNVDLASYKTDAVETRKKVVFKYYFLVQFLHRYWREVNICLRIPPHPNILPLDRLVLDELNGCVVGHTVPFIPGGTVHENTSRVFKLKWLEQLINAVDDLNLKYGITHQDIAARNVLVDEKSDNILLFDFNWSGQIGGDGYCDDRDDVKGVIFTLYETITRDMHFRQIPHDGQNVEDVQKMEDWPKHKEVKLDHPVSAYRLVLNDWVERRNNEKQITVYTEAPEHISWAPIRDAPKKPMTFYRDGEPIEMMVGGWEKLRRSMVKEGKAVLKWERPQQARVAGRHLLVNGEFEE